ncbi:MAG: MFS transporter [Janthinobacterium lividum]
MTDTPNQMSPRAAWMLILAAAAIMMITMGARQTMGLFVSPLNTSTGLGIVTISFALAIGQLVWGIAQPVFGAVADKYGSVKVIILGGVMLALGTAATPFMHSQAGLMFTIGLLTAAGAGAGSFSILIGATSQRLPAQRRSFASGFVNAGGSFGQFVFAPMVQAIISAFGWISAMLSVAALTLLTIPLTWPLRRQRGEGALTGAAAGAAAGENAGATADPLARSNAGSSASSSAHSATHLTSNSAARSAAGATAHSTTVPTPGAQQIAQETMGFQVQRAIRDRSYLLLHAGFFTCGFHIAFLVTHLPGEVALCNLPVGVSASAISLIGLFNIAGSLTVGALGTRFRMKNLLAIMYFSRALLIVFYLLAPKTALTFYIFAAALGATWLATVPPTVGLVGKLFGTRYLGTLFGLTMFSHQIGGFLGAWLGGLAFASNGNYLWMWYADIGLALAAGLLTLPVREAALQRKVVLA